MRPQLLIQITDCHLQAASGQLFRGIDPDAHLAAVVNAVRQRFGRADLLLLSGDLTHHAAAAYPRLLQLTRGLARDCVWLPGNHDLTDIMQQSEYAALNHKRVELGNWELLLCDSSAYPDGRGSGSLSEAELEWLESECARPTNRHRLLALHHNPLPTGSGWQDPVMLGNPQAFWQALSLSDKPFAAVLCGHLHQVFTAQSGDTQVLCTPATSVQFTPQQADFTLETRAQQSLPGYRWLQLWPDGRWRSGVERVALPANSTAGLRNCHQRMA